MNITLRDFESDRVIRDYSNRPAVPSVDDTVWVDGVRYLVMRVTWESTLTSVEVLLRRGGG